MDEGIAVSSHMLKLGIVIGEFAESDEGVRGCAGCALLFWAL